MTLASPRQSNESVSPSRFPSPRLVFWAASALSQQHCPCHVEEGGGAMQKKITPVLAGMVVVVLVSCGRGQPQLMTASSAAYPQLTPGVLAGFVAVPSNGLTVVAGTATAGVKRSGHPGAATDPRAIGFFGNGNTALRTSLQGPVDPNAVFAGGIGIPMGGCLW